MKTTREMEGPGMSLRMEHMDHVIAHGSSLGWFEVLIDNFLGEPGPHHTKLDAIRRDFPLVFHSVSMNLGGEQAPDPAVLRNLFQLVNRYQPQLLSDHLAWCAHAGRFHHDLLPVPRTDSMVTHIVERLDWLQTKLAQAVPFHLPIAVENPTTYLQFEADQMDEAAFCNAISKSSGCQMVLDINNVYVNSCNHGFDAAKMVEGFRQGSVAYYHIAGHKREQGMVIDTHGSEVSHEVSQLLERAQFSVADAPVCLERDDNVPSFKELEQELLEIHATTNRARGLL